MGFVSRDLISGLPNPLISHILSFLPTKEAASTSVLSKRWRFSFASVTNLEFENEEDDDEVTIRFMEFVDRVLSLQGNVTLNRFSLQCSDYPDSVRVNGWILNVLGRSVSDLHLSLSEYLLPFKIFVSKTLVKLKLGPGNDLSIKIGVGDVSLPKLKTLDLDSVVFEEEGVGFAKLLSGCPVLQELVIMNIIWEKWKFYSVSVATLKRLTFLCEDSEENPMSVSFDTPNLEYLEYSVCVAEWYPKVNFSSLVEAHIGLRLSEDQSGDASSSEEDGYFSGGGYISEDGYFSGGGYISEDDYFSGGGYISEDDYPEPEGAYFAQGDVEKEMVGNATKFILGICNVQILYLSAKALEVLAFCCNAIPIFNNLIQLTIESNSEIGWNSLPSLLKNCPNLETLVFKGLYHKRNNGCGNICLCKTPKNPSYLSSSPLKVLKIIMTVDTDDEGMKIEQIKHFLVKMPCLEQLIVYFSMSYDAAVFELSEKLRNIPRIASRKCKIQVISVNLSLAFTLPSSLSKKRSAPPNDEYSWFLNALI